MVTIRKPKNALKFSHPASWWGSTWREGLPAGNGVIGASVYGGAASDTIMINHADLWWQGHVGVLQDVADKLPAVRKKMDENSFQEAEHILRDALITKGYRPSLAYPLPLVDFKVNMQLDRAVREYARILNMENGEVSVTFRDGTTRYERALFVSRAQDIVAYEITRSGNKAIDVELSFELHERFNARTPSAMSKLPEGVTTKYENHFMYFSARSDNGSEFGAVAFVNYYGGSQSATPSGIRIKGAERVLVLIKPFIEGNREKSWKSLNEKLRSISKSTYDKLLKEHTPLHGKLFNSAELDLAGEDRDEFVDNLLDNAFRTGEVSNALLEKLWAYGRYLTVCGTSSASAPLAPCGLWCGDYKAQNSQITADGSLQTMYSHVLAGNLGEYMKSVFSLYESVMDDLKKNASRIFGCHGILVPSLMAHGTGVYGSVESSVLNFTGVGGTIARMFYDYALYNDDVKFLKEHALPFMKSVAAFYEDFFKAGDNNLYESCPSYSPYTTPANYVTASKETLEIARNATVDFAIAKDLLTNLVAASEATNTYKSDIPKWKDMLTRIPDYIFDADGAVREYIDNKLSDNPESPSTMFFYPVYPACESETRPELTKAFETAAKKKCTSAAFKRSSTAMVRYANIFAHFGSGNVVMDTIATVVREMAMNNLIIAASDWRGMGAAGGDIWASYTLESNMGITSALQEMLIQSTPDTLKILPALPDSLKRGSVGGLLTRVGVEITEMNWDTQKGVVTLKIKPKKTRTVNIALPKGTKKFKAVAGEKVDYEQGTVTGLSLSAGKVVVLDIRF